MLSWGAIEGKVRGEETGEVGVRGKVGVTGKSGDVEERSFGESVGSSGPRMDITDLSVETVRTTPEVRMPRIPTVLTVDPV